MKKVENKGRNCGRERKNIVGKVKYQKVRKNIGIKSYVKIWKNLCLEFFFSPHLEFYSCLQASWGQRGNSCPCHLCISWHHASSTEWELDMPILWHHFVFHFMSSSHTRLFQLIECAMFSLSLSPLPSVISSAEDLFSFLFLANFN